MKIRIRCKDLVTYAWLLHYAGVKMSWDDKKYYARLHIAISRGMLAYYDTKTDEIFIPFEQWA